MLAVAQTDDIVFIYRLGATWGDKKTICNKFWQQNPQSYTNGTDKVGCLFSLFFWFFIWQRCSPWHNPCMLLPCPLHVHIHGGCVGDAARARTLLLPNRR